METFWKSGTQWLEYLLSLRFLVTLLLAVLTIFLYRKINRTITRSMQKRSRAKKGQFPKETLLGVLKYAMLLIAVVLILQINGINVTGLLSGVGVIGIIVGFALQDELKDWIMGFFFAREQIFSVGDMVRYEDVEGVVTRFTLKCTVIKDLNNGNSVVVSNRNISVISKISDWCDVDVPASYDVPAQQMRDVCEKIARRVEELENVSACEFLGTQSFDASLIRYRLRARCREDKKNPTRRRILGIIQDVYAEENLKVPFDQLDVHLDK